MIKRMAYYLIFLLILLKSSNTRGSLRRKENYDLSRNKVINVLEKPQVNSEKNILVKRQVVIPIVTQSESLLPIFGNMCGLVLCCDTSCCCGNNYDTYDYDYYGVVVQPWPFYFMGSIYG